MNWIRTRILPTPSTLLFIAVLSTSTKPSRFCQDIQIHECSSEDPQLTPRILELLDAGFPVVLRATPVGNTSFCPASTIHPEGPRSWLRHGAFPATGSFPMTMLTLSALWACGLPPFEAEFQSLFDGQTLTGCGRYHWLRGA